MATKQKEQRPELTEKQAEVLAFVKKFLKANSYPPTLQEIATAIGVVMPTTASVHLNELERKGYINRGRGKFRAIQILD